MEGIAYPLALIIFTAFLFCTILHDGTKYTKNTPYTPVKKKNFFYRIILGLIAGIHYLHFIGTYNHKKYNTQVFTPKTLECYIGVFFAAVLWLTYLILAEYLQASIGIFGLSILLIPIITNIISFIKK